MNPPGTHCDSSLGKAEADSLEHARQLDAVDPLRRFRDEFLIPSKADLVDPHPEAKPLSRQNDPGDACTYLCGNSLGPQPRRTRALVADELAIWATRGVTGHFAHPQSRPWVAAAGAVAHAMARIVGAQAGEVAVMGSLTENIHLLLASFYRPAGRRTKILMEAKAFPSDHYAVESQIAWHGLDPAHELVLVQPRPGAHTLAHDDIVRAIDAHADDAALLFLSGVQYYTGQAFDMRSITAHAQSQGILVGWDLAHAAGNVLLALHDWGVDFAAWCSYKYLCSGPGGMAAIFVHARHGREPHRPRLAGWWGHDPSSRFAMDNQFVPAQGAAGYQVSNPCILSLAALRASLEVYNETTMEAIRTKSVQLTGYLERLLRTAFLLGGDGADVSPRPQLPFEIITPHDPEQRGAQLSLLFLPGLMMPVFNHLAGQGVVVDERKPDVIRVAPLPLVNSFEDCWQFVRALERALGDVGGHRGDTEASAVEQAARAMGAASL